MGTVSRFLQSLSRIVLATEIEALEWKISPIGGFCKKYINKTGAPSVKGETVEFSETVEENDSVMLTKLSSTECIGAFYNSGVADGEQAFVVTRGPMDVMLEDGIAAVNGGWVGTSAVTRGRVTADSASPPAAPTHFRECGHSPRATGSGVDVLTRIEGHFN